MPDKIQRHPRRSKEIEALTRRLQEAEEALRAIRSGEVDAIVVSAAGKEQIYTLTPALMPYRVLVEEMNEGVLTLSANGTILYCNTRIAELLALPAEQILGQPLTNLVAPAERAGLEADLQHGLTEKIRRELTFQNNQRVLTLVSLCPMHLDGVTHISVVATDITARKQAETELVNYRNHLEELVAQRTNQLQAIIAKLETEVVTRKRVEEALRASARHLHQARELLETVTRGTNVSIAAVDLNFCFLYFNTAYAEEIRRLTGKEIHLSANLLELFAEMPEQQQVVRDEWSQPLRGETTNKTFEFGDPGRYRRFYNILHTPMRDDDGNVIGAGEVVRDVTELTRAEQAQQENHATLQGFYDTAPFLMGIAELDGDKVVAISSNRATADFFAMRPEDLPGTTGDKRGAPADMERVWVENYRRSQRDGAPVQFDFEYPRADGNRWLSAAVSFIGIGSSGKPRFSFVAEDVTARQQSEQIIANLARFPRENPNPVLRVDQTGIILYANPASQPLLVEWQCQEGDRLPAEWQQLNVNAFFNQTVVTKEMQCDKKIFSVVAAPVRDEGYVNFYARDVTAQVRAQEALRASDEKSRNLIRYAPSAIYEIDFLSRKFINVNDVVCQWSGYTREELMAMDPLTLADETSRTVLLNQLQHALAGEPIESATEVRMTTKDGCERNLLLNIKTFTYHNGNPVSAMVIAHDITERKRMEQEIRQHMEELHTANEELVRFNRAAVGRELRMIELKKEVNALCGQAGQPPRYPLELAEEQR